MLTSFPFILNYFQILLKNNIISSGFFILLLTTPCSLPIIMLIVFSASTYPFLEAEVGKDNPGDLLRLFQAHIYQLIIEVLHLHDPFFQSSVVVLYRLC